MPGQVHQFFRLQDAWLDQVFGVRQRRIGPVGDELRAEQVDPLTVAGRGHACRPATVAREEFPI